MKHYFVIVLFSLFLILMGCEKEETLPVTASFEIENLGNGLIKFNNLSQNAETYQWDFGDSFTSTEANPSHQYNGNGNYEVVLSANNENNNDKHSVTLEISDFKKGSWTKIEDFPGGKRTKALQFKLNGKYYVGFGGVGYLDYTTDLWEYDPVTDTWSNKSDPPAPVDGGVSFVVGDYAYIGQGESYLTPSKRFWKYDPVTDTWTQLKDFPGYGGHTTITGASAFSHEGYGYVLNGLNTFTYEKEFWKYNPTGDSWTRLDDFPGEARHLSSHFKINDKLYLSCGAWSGATGNSYFYNDLWEYDFTTNTWTQKSDFPGEGRVGAVGFSLYGKGYIGLGLQPSRFSSNGGKYFSDIWQYEPETDAWEEMTHFPDVTRSYAFVLEFEDKVWVGTGLGNLIKSTDVWEYKID